MRRVLLLLLLAVPGFWLGTAVSGASDASPPPGATALCRDGTYSSSQSRSGTCSHHGGVAQWLTPGTTTTPGKADVGKTVLLGRRSRTAGCKLGPLPDRRCSPGAVYSKLSKAVLCSSSFQTSSIRNVPQSVKYAVERAYGLKAAHYGNTMEIDHIVSLEIGGSNDPANLYPELANARPGYHTKDKLENRLHKLVCDGSITLRAAQVGIATDWTKLHLRIFGVKP